MSFGVGVGDIALVASFAWQTYTAIKNAPDEFRALESEVQSLSISLKSFDDDDTRHAILNYTSGNVQREENFGALIKNSRSALKPLNDLVRNYHVKSSAEKKDVRDWLTGVRFARKNLSVQDFRNKLSMHTASLNIFLSSLTNYSIARLEKLLFAETNSTGGFRGISALGGSRNPAVSEDGLDGTWSAIGPSLIRGSLTPKEVASRIARFRVDIVNYLDFLMDGGKAYSRKELNKRRDETKAVTFSLPFDSDDLLMKKSKSHNSVQEVPDLMTLVDQMVMFDENGVSEEERTSRRNSYQVAPAYFAEPSPSPKQSPRIPSNSMGPPPAPSASSPRIITVEPSSSKAPNTKIYTYPVEMGRTPSGGREQPRSGSLSMARTGSLSNQPRSPTSPVTMARTPSGSAIYARSPSITQTMMARMPVGSGYQQKSPSFAKAVLASPPTVLCDVPNCKKRQVLTGSLYFHCGRCAEAGYDVCEPCYGQGKRCPGRHSGYHEKMEPKILGMLY